MSLISAGSISLDSTFKECGLLDCHPCRIWHQDKRVCTAAEFMDVVGTKVFPPTLFTVTSAYGFYSPSTLEQK
jgi:hypothetical protein